MECEWNIWHAYEKVFNPTSRWWMEINSIEIIVAPVIMAVIKKMINTCISMYIATLFTVARKWNQPRFTSKWVDKKNIVHTNSKILLSHEEINNKISK